jgi:hypothetical protein
LFYICQKIQLDGYGQYGMHGNIVNVPINLDLLQNVLPWMSYEDFSISMFKKCRIYICAMWHSFKSCYENGRTNLLNSIIYRCKSFNQTKLARIYKTCKYKSKWPIAKGWIWKKSSYGKF